MAAEGWLRRMIVEAVRALGSADIPQIRTYLRREHNKAASYDNIKSSLLRAVRAGEITKQAVMRGKRHGVVYHSRIRHLKGWGW